MDSVAINQKIKSVMSNIFSVSEQSIKEDSSPDNLESWTSLAQINLVVALEEEFEIQFTDEQVMSLVNFNAITSTIHKVLADRN